MRHVRIALLVCLLAGGFSAAQAELLWDNFLTANPATDGGFDGRTYFSSERNAAVPDTWATDDAVFEYAVTIDSIKWLGGRDASYEDYTVEIMVLAYDGEEFVEITDPPIAVNDWQVTGTFGKFFGFEVYNGLVDLPGDGLKLDAGHYCFGVRLVSENGTGDGRNVALSTGDGEIRVEQGVVRAGPPPFFEWTFVGDLPGAPETEFGFQLYGIPEPASLLLLTAGVFLARRRH